MRNFQFKRVGEPMQWPISAETPADALVNVEHCFGPGFEIVGHKTTTPARS